MTMPLKSLLLLCACWLPAFGAKYAGLWLEVSKETVPAGGVAQVRITLTEPKPIIRTRMELNFDESVVDSVANIGVFSENGEAVGTALRWGGQIDIEVVSPTANLGTVEEIPLLGLSMRLREDAPAGASGVVRIRSGSTFYKASGDKWYVESNAPGSLTVGGELSIDDVIPGGGVVNAGDTVKIVGHGFRPDTVLKFDGQAGGTTYFVSENELQFRPDSPMQMDQRVVSAANGDTVVQTVVAVLKGMQRSWSAYDLLAAITPLFSPRAARSATVVLPVSASEANNFAALALQNPEDTAANVKVELVGPGGSTVGAVVLVLAAHERFMRLAAELFPYARSVGGATLKIDSDQPVQVLGMEGSLVEGTAHPVIPTMVGVSPASFSRVP